MENLQFTHGLVIVTRDENDGELLKVLGFSGYFAEPTEAEKLKLQEEIDNHELFKQMDPETFWIMEATDEILSYFNSYETVSDLQEGDSGESEQENM
jgi:hypothetical protein